VIHWSSMKRYTVDLDWVISNVLGTDPMMLHETVAMIQEVPKMNAQPWSNDLDTWDCS